jgi:hypothetical protein
MVSLFVAVVFLPTPAMTSAGARSKQSPDLTGLTHTARRCVPALQREASPRRRHWGGGDAGCCPVSRPDAAGSA